MRTVLAHIGGFRHLLDPDILAREIVEELEAALAQFAGISEELGGDEG